MAEIASCWFSPVLAPLLVCPGLAGEEVGRSGLARGAVGSLLAMEVGTETRELAQAERERGAHLEH